MNYNPTPKQEQAIREWIDEAITPLIEQVLVKKLGQAMSFAAKEVVQPQRKPLTDKELNLIGAQWHYNLLGKDDKAELFAFARAIEAAHGIKGDA